MQKLLHPSLSKALLLSLGLCAGSLSASSVTSDPVGAVFYHFPATSDTYSGLSLARPSAFEGRIASVDVVNKTVTFSGFTDWATNQFVSGEAHYLYIKTGAEEGMHVKIVGNDADTLTVQLNIGDRIDRIVTGEAAAIVPYSTPQTMLGEVALNGMRIMFFRDYTPKVNHASDYQVEYNDGEWYVVGTGALASDEPIHPGEGFVVRNPGPAIDYGVRGVVPMAACRTVVRFENIDTIEKDSRVSFFTPVSILSTELPALNDGDSFYGYNRFSNQYGKAPIESLMFCWGEWYDGFSFTTFTTPYQILAGRGFLYRNIAYIPLGSVVLVTPRSYLL